MSCTEIYGLTKNNVKCQGQIKNAFRGAMSVWQVLEKRYLPKYIPSWVVDIEGDSTEYSRCHCLHEKFIKEIWDLVDSESISFTDKIVLFSTFDNVLVKVENIEQLINAFQEFEGETNLKEQAECIKKMISENKDIIAIGWNQTSICGDTWDNEHYNEETEEYSGYNLKEDNRHWFLFDEIQKAVIKDNAEN